MLPHETNRFHMPLPETVEIEWSGFVKTDNSQGCHQALMRCSSSGQATSGRWRGVNHDNFGGCGGGEEI
jgi:hypothetical protein